MKLSHVVQEIVTWVEAIKLGFKLSHVLQLSKCFYLSPPFLGYLYKNFPMNAILSEGVKPTLAELERFEETPEGTKSDRIILDLVTSG